MWISSRVGFVSIVQDKYERGKWAIRTRNRKDAEAVSAVVGAPVLDTPKGDYEYRVVVSKRKLKKFMLYLSGTVDYRNFKATMTGDTKRSAVHHKAWTVFLGLRDKPEKWAPTLGGSVGGFVKPQKPPPRTGLRWGEWRDGDRVRITKGDGILRKGEEGELVIRSIERGGADTLFIPDGEGGSYGVELDMVQLISPKVPSSAADALQPESSGDSA